MKTNYKELTEFLRFLNKIYIEYKGEGFKPTAEEFKKDKRTIHNKINLKGCNQSPVGLVA